MAGGVCGRLSSRTRMLRLPGAGRPLAALAARRADEGGSGEAAVCLNAPATEAQWAVRMGQYGGRDRS